MKHLKIIQNGIETVDSNLITKLAEWTNDGLDQTSQLKGSLLCVHAYADDIEALQAHQELNITVANGTYVKIDEAVRQSIVNTYGDGDGVTVAQLAAITSFSSDLFKNNTSFVDGSFIRYCTGLTSTGNLKFDGCTSLITLGTDTFPITKLGEAAFRFCQNLEGQLNFPNLTSIGTNNYGAHFCGCQKITKVTFGHVQDVRTVGSQYQSSERNPFAGCLALRTVDFGDSLVYLGGNWFLSNPNMECIVFRSATPPTSNAFSNLSLIFGGNSTCKVFVPDTALSAYQAATNFDQLGTTRLRPLSEYETGVANGTYI